MKLRKLQRMEHIHFYQLIYSVTCQFTLLTYLCTHPAILHISIHFPIQPSMYLSFTHSSIHSLVHISILPSIIHLSTHPFVHLSSLHLSSINPSFICSLSILFWSHCSTYSLPHSPSRLPTFTSYSHLSNSIKHIHELEATQGCTQI